MREGEQVNEIVAGARAKLPPSPLVSKRSRKALGLRNLYIYIIYTPNLGLGIAVSVREREQGRFRGSSEGARGRSKEALRKHGGARGSTEGASGGAKGRSKREPKLAVIEAI
jgi:hypothetical protein